MTANACSAPPLRVLVIIPCPADAPPFDAAGAWHDVEQALKPLDAQGLVAVERLTPPTENALKRRLAEGRCHVLHFIGHVTWRQAAHYGTLIFESSTGAARGLSTQYFGNLLGQHSAVELAVLQMPGRGNDPVGGPVPSLWERGPAVVVTTGTAVGRPQEVFTLKLYASLATGSTLTEAATHARDALASSGAAATVVLKTPSPSLRIVPREAATVGGSSAPVASPNHQRQPPAAAPAIGMADAAADALRDAARLAMRREVERKRLSAEFDVFLCHNRSDKPAVKRIAERLEERGILPWLDENELPPGQPWQPLLEKQIANIKSAAVFVGAAGVGPWQEQELYGFLREFVSRKSPVIPVLLVDAPEKPELPIFLRAMTWVDFRVQDPDPLSRLIWGITGRRPI